MKQTQICFEWTHILSQISWTKVIILENFHYENHLVAPFVTLQNQMPRPVMTSMAVTAAKNLMTRSNKRKTKTWGNKKSQVDGSEVFKKAAFMALQSKSYSTIIWGAYKMKWVGAISQLYLWSNHLSFQHVPTIQFSGPRPGWGRRRHCTAGGRRCPWKRWRWWAIRHRPNLTFYNKFGPKCPWQCYRNPLCGVDDRFLLFVRKDEEVLLPYLLRSWVEIY